MLIISNKNDYNDYYCIWVFCMMCKQCQPFPRTSCFQSEKSPQVDKTNFHSATENKDKQVSWFQFQIWCADKLCFLFIPYKSLLDSNHFQLKIVTTEQEWNCFHLLTNPSNWLKIDVLTCSPLLSLYSFSIRIIRGSDFSSLKTQEIGWI